MTQESSRPGPNLAPYQLEELEAWNNLAVGLRFRQDLVRVVRLRGEARGRVVQRQRHQAAAALKRLGTPTQISREEHRIQRETAVLYNKLTRLETAGKLRWDQRTRNWVLRPVFTRTAQNRPNAYTEDELLSRFAKVRRNGKGWKAACPAHEDKNPSLAITEGDKGWLIKCWAHCDFTDIVAGAGLETRRMFFA